MREVTLNSSIHVVGELSSGSRTRQAGRFDAGLSLASGPIVKGPVGLVGESFLHLDSKILSRLSRQRSTDKSLDYGA